MREELSLMQAGWKGQQWMNSWLCVINLGGDIVSFLGPLSMKEIIQNKIQVGLKGLQQINSGLCVTDLDRNIASPLRPFQ